MANQPLTTFAGGATRSPLTARFDLIVPEFYEAMAECMGRGLAHGRDNWKTGGPDFIDATLNHLEKHLVNYKSGQPAEKGEDDLVAVAVNAMFLWWFENCEMAKPTIDEDTLLGPDDLYVSAYVDPPPVPLIAEWLKDSPISRDKAALSPDGD